MKKEKVADEEEEEVWQATKRGRKKKEEGDFLGRVFWLGVRRAPGVGTTPAPVWSGF